MKIQCTLHITKQQDTSERCIKNIKIFMNHQAAGTFWKHSCRCPPGETQPTARRDQNGCAAHYLR